MCIIELENRRFLPATSLSSRQEVISSLDFVCKLPKNQKTWEPIKNRCLIKSYRTICKICDYCYVPQVDLKLRYWQDIPRKEQVSIFVIRYYRIALSFEQRYLQDICNLATVIILARNCKIYD